jgi:hypothetical protein
MKRDFLLPLSSGCIHDCLDWQLRQLDLPEHRRRTLERFSGIMSIDELHLGQFTLLLATDPVADEIIGFAVVSTNDQAHMRRFLLMLKHWGFWPSLVISDGSNLCPRPAGHRLAQRRPPVVHLPCAPGHHQEGARRRAQAAACL